MDPPTHTCRSSLAIVFISASNGANSKPHAFHLPIRKDGVKLQYYTSLEVGVPLHVTLQYYTSLA